MSLQIQELQTSIDSKNAEITAMAGNIKNLQAAVEQRDVRIETLENDMVAAVQRNIAVRSDLSEMREEMLIMIDDNEQYSRKDSLRIEGIERDENESHHDLGAKIVATLNSLGAKSSPADFHRYHRSGPPRKDDNCNEIDTIFSQTSPEFSFYCVYCVIL